MRRALITGITGQDGSYLTEFLLEKGYEVHGVVRRNSSLERSRLVGLYEDAAIYGKTLFLHYADLDDPTTLRRVLAKVEPGEVYHLAGQSHVGLSFEIPESTCEMTAMGTLRLLREPVVELHDGDTHVAGSLRAEKGVSRVFTVHDQLEFTGGIRHGGLDDFDRGLSTVAPGAAAQEPADFRIRLEGGDGTAARELVRHEQGKVTDVRADIEERAAAAQVVQEEFFRHRLVLAPYLDPVGGVVEAIAENAEAASRGHRVSALR